MPKTDYSNTVIYEIKCKDPRVKYSEIGATTNLKFVRHRFRHLKMEKNNPEFFKQITTNGGTDNWEIIILEEYGLCSSKNESNERVKEWKQRKLGLSQSLQAKAADNSKPTCEILERITKVLSIDPLACKYCNVSFVNKSSLKRHMPRCKVLKQLKDTANRVYKEAKIAYKEAKKNKAKINEEYNQIHDCS
tara:strand:- start:8609 stop:9181 length:573 start_codon:yes stop_codon:yes gene_type:complete